MGGGPRERGSAGWFVRGRVGGVDRVDPIDLIDSVDKAAPRTGRRRLEERRERESSLVVQFLHSTLTPPAGDYYCRESTTNRQVAERFTGAR